VELPELKTIEMEGPPSELDKGIVGLALPGAEVTKVYRTEWIEHSGKFERAYRAQSTETDKPIYLLIEFQTEREDEELPRRLLSHFATVDRYVQEEIELEDEVEQEDKDVEEVREQKGTIVTTYVDPIALCQFPQ